MSDKELATLVASVNSSSSLRSDLDLRSLIEKLGHIEYSCILKAQNNNIEFVELNDIKRDALLQIENSSTRRLVDLLSTTLCIQKTASHPNVLFTRRWFSLYSQMLKTNLDEDVAPFVIENIVTLETVLRWAMTKWVEELEKLRGGTYDSPDYHVFALVEIASMVELYEQLKGNKLFDIDVEEALSGFRDTVEKRDGLLSLCTAPTILYMHGHSLFEV